MLDYCRCTDDSLMHSKRAHGSASHSPPSPARDAGEPSITSTELPGRRPLSELSRTGLPNSVVFKRLGVACDGVMLSECFSSQWQRGRGGMRGQHASVAGAAHVKSIGGRQRVQRTLNWRMYV